MSLGQNSEKVTFIKKDAFYFALGGLMLGFGSRFGLGCNLGAMDAAISSFSFSGWVFLLAMTLGGIAGMKLFAGKVCILPHRIGKKTVRTEMINDHRWSSILRRNYHG